MTTEVISDSALGDWLLEPDCPQCGSEDVRCLETHPDGTKLWYCNTCGHTWVE